MTYADDFIAITDTKAKYCRFLDTKDWAAYADVFTEDLVLEIPAAQGTTVIQGRAACIAAIRSSVDTATTAHQVHNPEMRIEGDEAHVVWAMNDRVIWGPDRVSLIGEVGHTGYGQYHERYVRCPDGRWRIANQRLVYLIYDSQKA